MQKIDLYRLREGIKASGQFKGGRFQYALAKNSIKLNSEIRVIEEAMNNAYPYPEGYKAYDEALYELQKQYGKKNDQGGLELKGGSIVFDTTDAQENFTAAHETLSIEHRSVLDEYHAVEKRRQQFLEETCENLDWHKIKPEDIPEDATGVIQLIVEFLD